ncbi:hypothetical protein LINGRAHAP2_LOCUS6434 [Linum grandiflorum]
MLDRPTPAGSVHAFGNSGRGESSEQALLRSSARPCGHGSHRLSLSCSKG